MLNSALKDYHEFTEEKPDEDIEKLIIENDDIAKHICYSYGGTILQTVFGSYKIIFEDIGEALKGARKWATMWEGFLKENTTKTTLASGCIWVISVLSVHMCLAGTWTRQYIYEC